MDTCTHGLDETTCVIHLYGRFYDPYTRRNPLDHGSFHSVATDGIVRYLPGGGGGCPSDDLWSEPGFDHTPRRPATPGDWPPVVGRPGWVTLEFTGTSAYMGFYKDELANIAGFGFDPDFYSTHTWAVPE